MSVLSDNEIVMEDFFFVFYNCKEKSKIGREIHITHASKRPVNGETRWGGCFLT